MLLSPRENTSLAQRRIHSPSLPDLWVPPAATVSRPSLDLASTPAKSALPLTPPLTPASTKPLPAAVIETLTVFDTYVDFSPVSQWSASDPTCPLPMLHTPATALLPSPTSPTHPQPRGRDLDPDQPSQPASRFLFITGIPKSVSSQALKQAFVAFGDLKGIFIRFQADHGAIVLAFFDLRHTIRAHRQISTHTFFDGVHLESRFISPDELRNLIGQSNFVNQNDGDLFISTSFVGPQSELDAAALQNVLASFGDLRSFAITDTHARVFHVEYFDARDASSALSALDARVILGVRLHLSLRDEHIPFPPHNPLPDKPASPTASAQGVIPFPPIPSPILERRASPESSLSNAPRHTALHHSVSEQNLRVRCKAQSCSDHTPHSPTPTAPLESQVLSRVKTPPQHVHGRRISNIYHFDSVGKMEQPRTPPRPRSISVSSDTASPVAGRLALPPSPATGRSALSSSPAATRLVLPPYQGPLPVPHPSSTRTEETAQWPQERETAYSSEQYPVGSQQALTQQPVLQLQVPLPTRRHLPVIPRHAHTHAHAREHGSLGLEFVGDRDRERETQPERNRIDIGKIERGEETRTTVMIKNIPNKMSDRHLIDFINDVCPRKIDFLYLRMDFTNGCNVGYAFVNFIHVEDLLHFAKTKLGTKWNMFSSEKILGMSYANYQGKEALIDKFRSSSIMDQREAWRPKLFYSHGPKKGLPEEFPAPTHMRRKERSNLLPGEFHQTRGLFYHHPPGMRG